MPPTARRPPRAVLSPSARRVVAALLIAAGALLLLAQLLRLWVIGYAYWHGGPLTFAPLAGIVLGLGASGLLAYAGYRVGLGGGAGR